MLRARASLRASADPGADHGGKEVSAAQGSLSDRGGQRYRAMKPPELDHRGRARADRRQRSWYEVQLQQVLRMGNSDYDRAKSPTQLAAGGSSNARTRSAAPSPQSCIPPNLIGAEAFTVTTSDCCEAIRRAMVLAGSKRESVKRARAVRSDTWVSFRPRCSNERAGRACRLTLLSLTSNFSLSRGYVLDLLSPASKKASGAASWAPTAARRPPRSTEGRCAVTTAAPSMRFREAFELP